MGVSQLLSVTQISQNIAKNTSTVRISLTSTQGGESYNMYTLTGHYYISKNGGEETEYTFTTQLPKRTTVTCFTTDVEVEHNSDGTGKINVRTVLDTHISAGTVRKSKELELTTIPRSTFPVLSTEKMDIGNTVTIGLPRASEAFTHKVEYICESVVGSIATSAAESVAWTAPLDLIAQAPNSASIACAILVTTYAGETQIGNTQTAYMTLTVPEDISPSITNVVIQDTQNLYDKYNAYVQYKSKLKISVTAEGTHGSTIKGYQIVANEVSYSQPEVETDFLRIAGSNRVQAVVIDTRDREAAIGIPINVLAYGSPTISKFAIERCTEDGTPDQEGSYGKVTMIGAITPLNDKNKKEFKLEYKKSTDSIWTSIQKYSVYELNTSKIVPCHVDNIYNFRITATDDFSTTTYEVNLGTAYTLIDFRNTGKGIAFGKVSTQDGFECAMPMKARAVEAESISATSVEENGVSIGSLRTELDTTNQEVAKKIGTDAFGDFQKVNGLYIFKDSDNALIATDKGNYVIPLNRWE